MAQFYDYQYRGDPHEFMARVSRIPNLEADEELALIMRCLAGPDEAAMNHLLAAHQKLLVKEIFKSRLQDRFEDALQAGNMGMMKAINKFEPETGFRLSTYARWWVKAGLEEVSAKPMVNMITTAQRKSIKNNLRRALSYVAKGREPTEADLKRAAELMSVDLKDIKEMYPVMMHGDFELDAPVKSATDGGTQALRVDMLADPSPNPEDIAIQLDEVERAKARIAEAMQFLNEPQKAIFQARRLDDPKRTLEDLAATFNVSRERIRQIEERAFEIVQAYVRDGVVYQHGNDGRRKKAVVVAPAFDMSGG